MITHISSNDHTFCGKHIDRLGTQDSLLVIRYDIGLDYLTIAKFKATPGACKLCLNELLEEEQLKRQNTPTNEEVDDPVI